MLKDMTNNSYKKGYRSQKRDRLHGVALLRSMKVNNYGNFKGYEFGH
jgi:hypothetical protein